MKTALFTFTNLKMSDDEFWTQIRELDEIGEQLTEFNGLAIKARSPEGRQIHVPFVRFGKTISDKKS